MKRVLIVSAVALLCSLSIPSSVSAENLVSETSFVQEDVKYEVLKAGELPAMIQTALTESFSDYSLLKSFIGSDGSYKLILSKAEGNIAVYFNAEGDFVKQEDVAV
jgi:D-tyrosyl-tRNA(Tyr) deacylase